MGTCSSAGNTRVAVTKSPISILTAAQRVRWLPATRLAVWEELPADTVKGAPRVLAAVTSIPYPSWLNSGDNTWQLTAATLVGLMSLPGLAVLYAGLVQRKWAVNTLLMIFSGF